MRISMMYVSHMEGSNPFSAGIDFRRQNLTSIDIRF